MGFALSTAAGGGAQTHIHIPEAALAGTATWYVRIKFRSPASWSTFHRLLGNQAGGTTDSLRIASSGQIQLIVAGQTWLSSASGVITLGQIQEVEVIANGSTIVMNVDGNPVASGSGSATWFMGLVGASRTIYTPGAELYELEINCATYHDSWGPLNSPSTGLVWYGENSGQLQLLNSLAVDDSQWVYYDSGGGSPPVQETNLVLVSQRSFSISANANIAQANANVLVKQSTTSIQLKALQSSVISNTEPGFQYTNSEALTLSQLSSVLTSNPVFQIETVTGLITKQSLAAILVSMTMRTTADTLLISDDPILVKVNQRSTADVLFSSSAASLEFAMAHARTYSSWLQISATLNAVTLTAKQRTTALLLSITRVVTDFKPENISASLITDRFEATRLTSFFNAQIISSKNTATKL